MSKLLLKGGTIVSAGKSFKADILIEDSVISSVSPSIPESEDFTVRDLTGLTILPGLVDLHVHFREPGYTNKETIRTGSLAAAHGGYTTVCTMPNLNPVPDTVEHLQAELDAINRDAIIDVLPYCAITIGRKGLELVDMKSLKNRCIAFSDDGSGVQEDAMMREAMRCAAENDCIIAAHCEDNRLLKGGYIHEGSYCLEHGHKGICSESEWRQIARDISLAEETGCRYHVCHISTKESVRLIREAKERGVKVTCETAPHYLLLSDKDLQEDGRFKMNPPLRSDEDREALIEGIKDGTIDVIATDHAPHTAEEKSRGLRGSAMGIVGLESSFQLLYTYLVKKGVISLEKLVELMSITPRNIFRIGGGISAGCPADLTIIDTSSSRRIDSSEFLSMGRSTPFEGWEVKSETVSTYSKGKEVYSR